MPEAQAGWPKARWELNSCLHLGNTVECAQSLQTKGDDVSMKRIHMILILFLSTAGLLALGLPCRAQQQAPPKQKKPAVQPAQPEQQEEYTEEEYDAYEKATQEPDLDKRGTMLLAFMDKYPKSKLMTYIVTAYQTLMYEHQKNQRYAKLLPLAEQWLKYHPDDLQTIAYIAESANRLGQDQKYIDYALKIYAVKPDCNLAASITNSYEKIGNKEKSLEWTEKLFSCPEFDGNSTIRMIFVKKYWDEKKLDKAAQYAGLALKALEAAKKPDDKSDADWRKDRTEVIASCNNIIGLNYLEKEKYAEAIKSLEKVVKVKKDCTAYYYIGRSQWKLDQVDDAMLSFAVAERCGGDRAGEAKAHLEKLYKAIHNNTLIGIEKIYAKAERVLAGKPAE
jgi:tetratricopeptide (TPR) repeat protein